jgi:hypothetical protein
VALGARFFESDGDRPQESAIVYLRFAGIPSARKLKRRDSQVIAVPEETVRER